MTLILIQGINHNNQNIYLTSEKIPKLSKIFALIFIVGSRNIWLNKNFAGDSCIWIVLDIAAVVLYHKETTVI